MNPTAQKEALDPTIVNLAKAIRETETRGQKDPYTARGGSGEFGAYQYTKPTWEADSKAFLGRTVPLEQADKLTQNEVAYKKLKSLKDKGYNVGQIASIWNSGGPEWEGKVGTNKHGVKYDVPQYVDAVSNAYQALKRGQAPLYQDTASTVGAQEPVAAASEEEGYKPWFGAKEGDTGLTAGLKAFGNLIPSAFNFAKGAVSALNPVNTLSNIAQIPGAFSEAVKANQGSVGTTLGRAAGAFPGEAYRALAPVGVQQAFSGDIGGAARTFTEDPFGQAAPLVLAAQLGARGVDAATGAAARARMASYVRNIGENVAKGAPVPRGTGTNLSGALDASISRAAQTVIKPTAYAFGKAKAAAAAPVKYAAAKTTGFQPETISQIARRPELFTKEAMANTTRASLGEEVGSVLKEKKAAVAETGKAYAPIRASKARVKVAPAYIDKTIAETTGLSVAKGKLKATGSSSIRDAGDIRALQNVYDLWKPEFAKGYLTADQYLNFRADLGKMAKYGRELTSSKPLENLADVMRGKLSTEYRGKVPGLEALDKRFGPLTSDLRRLGKDFIDPKTGELRDAAINRIANAAGKGKDALLGRLEEIAPGITLKIRTLKAIEDIQNIHKVGTYTKSFIEGGGIVGGIATGNIPLIVGSVVAMLLTQPEAAVRIIRTYGQSRALAGAVLQEIGKAGGAVNQSPSTTVGDAVEGARSVFGRPPRLPAPVQ